MSPLHIDKRPPTLKDFYGNEGIKTSLDAILSRKSDVPHTFLFTGSSGCGKTTLGRIVAARVGCSPMSIHEYNSSNTRGIDTIREISQNAQMAPMSGKVKAYIIDECHAMTKDAQNAFLKVLEDTPKHVYFILCTTDPEKLLPAIKTRCMTFEVKPLASPVLTKLVKDTVKSEGIDDFPTSVVTAIVKASDGCPRQAMILLDSVIDLIDENEALAAIQEGCATVTASIDLCRLLLEDRKGKWENARELLKGLGEEPEKVRYAILGYLGSVLISDNCKNPDHISSVIDLFTESFMYSGKAGLYNAVFYACKG